MIDGVQRQISSTERVKKEYEQKIKNNKCTNSEDEDYNVEFRNNLNKIYQKKVELAIYYINHYKELINSFTDFHKFAIKIYNEALNEEYAFRAKISKIAGTDAYTK